MISRPFWLQRLHSSWEEAPIAWLSGVRRVGKTTLADSLGADQVLYLNCDLPSTEEVITDPEMFYRGCTKPVVVFDEIHQLRDPARVLNIGADAFPKLKILATGSSTLAASKKFRDTLTGRKRLVHLTPVLWDELEAFGVTLQKRLFHGGLPPALLSESKKSSFYREWAEQSSGIEQGNVTVTQLDETTQQNASVGGRSLGGGAQSGGIGQGTDAGSLCLHLGRSLRSRNA